MSAVPDAFMREPAENRRPQVPRLQARMPEEETTQEDSAVQTFWHWFAIAVLLFCWLAEATLCAERGF